MNMMVEKKIDASLSEEHFSIISSGTSLFANISQYRPFFQEHTNSKGELKRTRGKSIEYIQRSISTKNPLKCAQNGLEVQFFETDHSIPGAGAF